MDKLEEAMLSLLPATGPVKETGPVVGVPDATPLQEQQKPAVGDLRKCRHCNAEFASAEKRCPACGKAQSGVVKGKQRSPDATPVAAPPTQAPQAVVAEVQPALTDAQIARLEGAIGDTFTFLCEDIAGPMMFGKGAKLPAFGDKRAGKLGAVWAPVLAPYINSKVLGLLLVVAVTTRGLTSYFRECAQVANTQQPLRVDEKK